MMDLMEAPFHVPMLRRRGLYVSVFDVLRWVTGKSLDTCRHMWAGLLVACPDLEANCRYFKFNIGGVSRHVESPGVDARTAVEIIMIVPGGAATRFRQKAGDAVVRLLNGDPHIVQEVWANQAQAPEGVVDLENHDVRDSVSEIAPLEEQLLWVRIQRERAEAENLRAQCLLATITAVEAAGRIPGVAHDPRYFSLRRDVALRALLPSSDERVDAAEYLRLQGLTDEAVARLAGSFSRLLRTAFMKCFGEPSSGRYERIKHRAFLAAGFEAFSQKASFKRLAGDTHRTLEAYAIGE